MPYFFSKYDPDALRFYLTTVAPETRDTEFSWDDFVERNNNKQAATWPQSVANRMLSFAYKRFDGQVPEPGELDDEDRKLLALVEAGFETVGDLYAACKFRAAEGAAAAGAALQKVGREFDRRGVCAVGRVADHRSQKSRAYFPALFASALSPIRSSHRSGSLVSGDVAQPCQPTWYQPGSGRKRRGGRDDAG